MSNYPDWVNAFKEKGTSIKKVGNEYYLYRSTSKRVPGKKYPQPVETYIGTITREGVIQTKIRKISTDRYGEMLIRYACTQVYHPADNLIHHKSH